MSTFTNPAGAEAHASTAPCQDDPWQGAPSIAFGPGKDGHLRILQYRYRVLNERRSDLSRERYELASGPHADHGKLARIDGERAQLEFEIEHVAAAVHAELRALAAT